MAEANPSVQEVDTKNIERRSMTILSLKLKQDFEKTATSISEEEFHELLNTSLQGKKKTSKKLHAVYTKKISEHIWDTWNSNLCEEIDLGSKFEILENQIKKYANSGSEKRRPEPGNVESILKAHRIRQLSDYKSKLEESVLKMESECEVLKQTVLTQRKEFAKSEQELVNCKNTVDNINYEYDSLTENINM